MTRIVRLLWAWAQVVVPLLVVIDLMREGWGHLCAAGRALGLSKEHAAMVLTLGLIGVGGWLLWPLIGGGIVFGSTLLLAIAIVGHQDIAALSAQRRGVRREQRVIDLAARRARRATRHQTRLGP